jgi:hypothetical protein
VSTTTFQKRQKEMKRQEKQRAKADRRAQKKLADKAAADSGEVSSDPDELRVLTAPIRNADFEQ